MVFESHKGVRRRAIQSGVRRRACERIKYKTHGEDAAQPRPVRRSCEAAKTEAASKTLTAIYANYRKLNNGFEKLSVEDAAWYLGAHIRNPREFFFG